MKAFKSLAVLIVLSSVLSGCEKWKDFIPKDDKRKVYTRQNLPVNGQQEVPQRVTPALGTLDVSYDKKTKKLKYTVKWAGLTGVPTGAHIHGTAPKGVNAPVKHPFTDLIPKSTAGIFTNSVMVDGVAIKEDSLLKGFYYVNIHTATFPGGEIRGQIEFK